MMPPFPPVEGECRVVLQGRPELRCRAQDVLETAWQYADDRDWSLVQRDVTPDDYGVGPKAPAPQPIADHHDEGALRYVVRCLEIPSESGLDAQDAKEVRAHELAVTAS